ncbi:MAG TPA: hypothetical protein VK763_00645 [Terriglobales bacterium]|nr:hypothetical protein [Terriglobales bacterium]
MAFPRFAFLLLTAGMCLGTIALAQKTSEPTIDNAFVEKQFGSNCRLVGMPSVRGDLDGDGVEDIVIPARCTSPLMDQAENNYVVIDPYDGFFGYGNPKVTTAFVADDPLRRGFSLLVIHGAGPDAWHAAVPKAKFMLVNIPYRDIKIRKLQVKKKARMAIYVEETGGDAMTSMVYFDGKKYRYDPMGSSME